MSSSESYVQQLLSLLKTTVADPVIAECHTGSLVHFLVLQVTRHNVPAYSVVTVDSDGRRQAPIPLGADPGKLEAFVRILLGQVLEGSKPTAEPAFRLA